MQGKTVLITGATSGIGYHTALRLASMGARVAFTSRNEEKGRRTAEAISRECGHDQVHVIPCDLASFASVRDAASGFREQFDRLDVLINNAGLWENRRRESKDGVEMNLAVNHLAPFLMTLWLLPMLRQGEGGRVISVSSDAHKSARFNFDDPELKKMYIGFVAYAQSKLANILFVQKLGRLYPVEELTANALHPGVVATQLFDKVTPWLKRLFGIFMRAPRNGARTNIYLASSPEVAQISGKYFVDQKPKAPSKAAQNTATADALWDLSKRFVNDFLPPEEQLSETAASSKSQA
jgi:NAD(P)-dependent dehydrogenase (short-subunit alcohol dehydrogenase family)